ncbi:MAG: hypothetical protein JWP02_2519 [Acidimicrobiales bacterium]|nr:hypothetical protein [Acidimicrobiales bacterium]
MPRKVARSPRSLGLIYVNLCLCMDRQRWAHGEDGPAGEGDRLRGPSELSEHSAS